MPEKKKILSRKELRAALAAVYDDQQAYYGELSGESARAAAILLASELEDQLEKLIRRQFPAAMDDEKLWKRLAGSGSTPFGSAKAKADVAQAFDFYGARTRKVIDTIFVIRNKFAHLKGARDFDHKMFAVLL